MPYSIKKDGDQFCVYNNETGKKMGEHNLRQDAVKQMRALYAKEGKAEAKGKKSEKSEKKSPADEEDYED